MSAMDAELLAGRYELVEAIGKGATGRVWRGLDTLLLRPVAIKVVDLEGARDPAMAERFRREGIAIAGVSHDSIVKVFDTGTDDERGWLVMELLSGPNCNDLVKGNGPISFAVGMPLLARVADGLQAAHDVGITHRDVKPANIVLDAPPAADGAQPDLLHHPEAGRPVLVDFGIAHIVDEAGLQLTRPATAIGTAAYMSPEQARGQRSGPASDVYSLACVAYHLFLGRPPFVAPSSLAVAHSQAFDTPVPLAELSPDAPPALDTLLTRMLAKDATVRPSAREVAAELRAITLDPTMAPSVPLPAPPTQALAPEALTAVLPETPSAEAVPQELAAPDGSQIPYPALVETAPSTERSSFHNAGRWLVGLLIVALVAALAYSWMRRSEPPPQPPTVTLTTTQTATSHVPVTQPPPEPAPSSSILIGGPVTQAPPATVPTRTGAQPSSTAAPTPTTSEPPPPSASQPVPPETTEEATSTVNPDPTTDAPATTA